MTSNFRPAASVLLALVLLAPLPLFAAGHDLTRPRATTQQFTPVVTGNGSGFMAAWIEAQAQTTIVVQPVSSGGEPIEGAGSTISQRPVQSIAIAHSPFDTLVVWTAAGHAFAERLSTAGTPLDTIALTSVNEVAEDVAVAWNGSRYFVVWSNGIQLLGVLLAPDGSFTTPHVFFGEPFVIGERPPAEFALVPDVAWDGRNFIVVFGEAPNVICTTLCPTPAVDHFLVMRVSAAGDAIDSSPLTISGSHSRAHVASSGAESLIALDASGLTSTIVAHDEDGLTLDPERALFRWYFDVASGLAWDGAMYAVAWRYRGADSGPAWIGAARVTRLGLPLDFRVSTIASPIFNNDVSGPSVATNDAGATAFVTSEAEGRTSPPRARLYLASELVPMPPPPPAPVNAVSYFGGTTARIDWQQSETPTGFFLEWSFDFGKSWYLYKTISGDARTTTVTAFVGNLFRIRAFGPGGVSDGPITSIGSMQRRRADRH
jgi:hypothetical protein